ncbi:MAG: hypothetical protein KatS3mg077_3270 [Candidatus Binatia bacterium]|nr:MAG: hypothetical protein KatS3mg077_3270 [Candidatus Binatia bacterium]
MTVKVRLFAVLRERTGVEALDLSLATTASVGDAWNVLQQRHPSLAAFRGCVTFAVNREYVGTDHPLADGDELALIPPVSGGVPGGMHP